MPKMGAICRFLGPISTLLKIQSDSSQIAHDDRHKEASKSDSFGFLGMFLLCSKECE